MQTDQIYRDTRIIVDLDQIAANMLAIKEMVGNEVAVMAVVKANAYGLGSLAIAPTLMENGANYLAVATLTEAIDLRSKYPDYPLFILGHTPDRYLHKVAELNITQTVFSLHQARLLSDISKELGKRTKIHVKLDTGFHRLGSEPTEDFARNRG